MNKTPEYITINGMEYVIIYSKTRKGKPHPKGGIYRIPIPVSDYKPFNRKQ